jgi:uncharacterized repeat protein (TIGR01451 family)
MKKNYSIITLCLILLCSYNRSSAYSIVAYSGHDSCKQGTTYSITIDVANSNLSLFSYFGDGTSGAGMIFGTSGYNNHNYLLPGIFTIKHILLLSGVPVDSVIFTDTVMCENGFAAGYLDLNSNCVMDASEPMVNSPMDIEIDSAGIKIDTLHAVGGAFRALTAGKTYSMKILNPPTGASVTCPSSGVITNTTLLSGATIFLFGLQCGSSSTFDLAEHVTVRAGRHTELAEIVVTNTSCNPQSGILTANLSPKYTSLNYAHPTPTSVTGNTVVWTLPNISATNTYHLQVSFERTGSSSNWLTPGDTIHTSFYLTPTSGDVNTANNTVVRVDTVKSSFDPNDKAVMPQGNIAPGTDLEYTIQFENDGNDTARNIYILDTLSSYIDANSIRVVATSAKVMISNVITSGSNNIVKFDFPNIMLPDSSHHEYCHGMVVFRARAKNNLLPGTVIPNRAGIYFDDNEVVMTPTVKNYIPVLSVDNVHAGQLVSAYPNPVHDVLTVETRAQYNNIRLVNTLGQTMLEQKAEGLLQTKMDVSALSNGIYYLVLTGPAGSSTAKIEKQ